MFNIDWLLVISSNSAGNDMMRENTQRTIEMLKKVWNVFKVNNKDTKATSLSSDFVNFEHIFFFSRFFFFFPLKLSYSFFLKTDKNTYKLQEYYKANIYAVLSKSNLTKASKK